jgi:hypothetical protein
MGMSAISIAPCMGVTGKAPGTRAEVTPNNQARARSGLGLDRHTPYHRPTTPLHRDPSMHPLASKGPGTRRASWILLGLATVGADALAAGPADHADYVVLGKSINTRQLADGSRELLNTVFFAEIFEAPQGTVTNGVLRGPGEAAGGLRFPDGDIHFLAGTRQFSIADLSRNFPDATYHFEFDTPDGRINDLPVTFRPGPEGDRNPGPIALTLRQGGRVVDADAVDPEQDLEVEWTPFSRGAEDPLGIADDMIYVIFGNCLGEETVHSGHAISDPSALSFRDTRFTIPASALAAGEPHQLEVEHSEMDTGIEDGIETIVTYAATTFLDIHTTGAATGDRACGEVPLAMDGGQTDRPRREP